MDFGFRGAKKCPKPYVLLGVVYYLCEVGRTDGFRTCQLLAFIIDTQQRGLGRERHMAFLVSLHEEERAFEGKYF